MRALTPGSWKTLLANPGLNVTSVLMTVVVVKADVVFGEGVGVVARQIDRRGSGGDGAGGAGCVSEGQPGDADP